jgi:protein subunit release factor A
MSIFKEEELKFEVIYSQTGTTERPGGQQAGNPHSSVRISHIESGLMAQCGWYNSQHKNKKMALSMLEWAFIEIGLDK